MTIGLLMLGNATVGEMTERARLAEDSKFAAVWLADERFYREVYGCLTHFAAHTSRVRLGPCVTDPYCRHPALTAMAIATLDEISGGRAVLGIGAGISGFVELGIERKKPPRALREAIELIRLLLRGEPVDFTGEIVTFRNGRLSFTPHRPEIPIYIASNGPQGQRMAGVIADGVIMEGCAAVEEVAALRAAVDRGATASGRAPGSIKLVARLNLCLAEDGKAARDAVRPGVARMLGARRLRFATAEARGLTLSDAAVAQVAGVHYAAGVAPYLPLLPLVSDRHVDAFTLAGTVGEVADHVADLVRAGLDEIIVMPLAAPGGSVEATIAGFGGEVWPRAAAALGREAAP